MYKRQTVQSVDDGDTITVRERGNSFTIDLDCIDAPELAQRPFGAVAQKRLQALIPIGSAVDLRYVSLDMKGRLVGEVFSKGHNINLVMVRKVSHSRMTANQRIIGLSVEVPAIRAPSIIWK